MDFTKYFDKKPLSAFAYGPSGSGIVQAQPYTVEWSGLFQPTSGVFLSAPTGNYFFRETTFPNTKEFSFAFDNQSNFWFAYGQESTITLSYISGNSRTDYSFAGFSPAVFNNSILKTGTNATYCFYLKGDNNVYYKSSSENFSTERVLVSGNIPWKRLDWVAKLPEFYYRFGVYGIDEKGDGHKIISSKYPPMFNEIYRDFELEPTGEMTFLIGMQVEADFASGYCFDTSVLIGDAFETTPTGNINSLTSGNNMIPGYFTT